MKKIEGGCHCGHIREGNDLQARGLYLDEPPWQAHVFSL